MTILDRNVVSRCGGANFVSKVGRRCARSKVGWHCGAVATPDRNVVSCCGAVRFCEQSGLRSPQGDLHVAGGCRWGVSCAPLWWCTLNAGVVHLKHRGGGAPWFALSTVVVVHLGLHLNTGGVVHLKHGVVHLKTPRVWYTLNTGVVHLKHQ